MKLKREMTHSAAKVKGKLTRVFDPEQLESLARQSEFIQRSTSKLTGTDFAELLSTEMLDNAAVSLEGLCDLLRQLNPEAAMSPQALQGTRARTWSASAGSQASTIPRPMLKTRYISALETLLRS